MVDFPKGLMRLTKAAEKYGLKASTLRDYAERGRLEAVKEGKIWYTTDKAMKDYLRSRNVKMIRKG